MEKLIISTQKEAGISDEAIYVLFQEAFRQWTDYGSDAPFLHLTLEEFKKNISNAFVFVAVDAENGDFLGTHTLQPNKKKNFVHGCFLSVSPKVKRTGIASQMLRYEEDFLRKAGFNYLQGTTSTNAIWSVNWHLKNGYRIIGYNRSSANYSTYFFRKQLTPSLIWSGPLAPITARICFFTSYTITNLCKTSTGQLNLLGKIAKRLLHG